MPESPTRPLLGDLVLYLASAGFAVLTAYTSTLAAHRAWGEIAWYGYAAAALLALVQLAAASRTAGAAATPLGTAGAATPLGTAGAAAPLGTTGAAAPLGTAGAAIRLGGAGARAGVAAFAWAATALLPLVVEAISRAGGHAGRAQEEVIVVERAGARLVESATPYLTRDAIAALPADERLLGYTPYQPGMALFGLPGTLADGAWWGDARVWFALATAAALAGAFAALRRRTPAAGTLPDPRDGEALPPAAGAPPDPRDTALVRAGQLATVLPLSALTLATGGDDLPVLALCLLALALAARERFLGAGLAIGAAGALKLFAWPVAAVLVVLAMTRGRRVAARYAAPAFGVPLLALLPPVLLDAHAVVENVVAFPFGHGLVTSPAQSPLLGRLIVTTLPAGRLVALGLLGLLALALAGWLYRRPPTTAAKAAVVCAVGLTGAIVLLPATRFGYLLYPVSYAFAVAALRLGAAARRPEADRGRRAGVLAGKGTGRDGEH